MSVRNVPWTTLMKMALTRRRGVLVSLTRTADYQCFRRYAGVVRGANAYIPPGARKAGVIEDNPKSDIPKVSINGPDGATVTPQVSTSNGTTPTPAIVSTALLCQIPDTHFERSLPVMPSFPLSAISSAARSKGSPRRSKPSSGLNVISGPRISSSSVSRSRSVQYSPSLRPEMQSD